MEYYGRFTDEYLAHHGILGMHWGVRRYQNPDGSLTPEGKLRYGKTFTDRYVTKLSKLGNGRYLKLLYFQEGLYKKYVPTFYGMHTSMVRKFYPNASEETIRLLSIMTFNSD